MKTIRCLRFANLVSQTRFAILYRKLGSQISFRKNEFTLANTRWSLEINICLIMDKVFSEYNPQGTLSYAMVVAGA
jgi:hypothetical protein